MNDDSLASSGVTIQVEENFVTAPIELCAETSIWQNTLDIVIKTLEQVRDFVEIDSYVQDAMTVFSRHTDVDDEPLREARLSAEKAILEVIPVLKYIAAGIHRRSDESIN